jgi:hypothetical protein
MMHCAIRQVIYVFNLVDVVPNVWIDFTFPGLLSLIRDASCAGKMDEKTLVLLLGKAGENCFSATWMVNVSCICSPFQYDLWLKGA